MADFGVNSTQLSDPQGQGASPVAPATQSLPNVDKHTILTELGDIFAKGLKQNAKEEAEARKASVVGEYVNNEKVYSDALTSGQWNASQVATASRANFMKMLAGYPQYTTELMEARKAVYGGTEQSEAQSALETQKKRREEDISFAKQRGFQFLEGMSKQAEDDQVKAAFTSFNYEKQLEANYKANAEKRAQGTFDQQVADREQKDLAVRMINDIAGDNITAFQGFTTTLGDNVKSGKMLPEEAQAKLSERFSNISAAIVSAARVNPELAAPYRSLFESMNEVGKKLIDPKQYSEQLQDQLKTITTRMKLVAMSDPKSAGLIVANELFPNNFALQSSTESLNVLARLSANPVTSKDFVPQAVGNPDVEPEVLKMLKKGIQNINTGKVGDKEKAEIQASNSANQILKQTGKLLDNGASAKDLKGLAEFFASPEYASLVQKGKIDPEAATTAKRVFQLTYEPAIIKGVQERLNATLFSPDTNNTNFKPTKAGDVVDVKWSGSGITFEPKAKSGMLDIELRHQLETVNALKNAQTGINQLIRIGAHLEGETNYSKYWEENKHLYLPSMFPAPEGSTTKKQQFVNDGGLDVTKLTPAQITFLIQQNPDAFKRGVESFNRNNKG